MEHSTAEHVFLVHYIKKLGQKLIEVREDCLFRNGIHLFNLEIICLADFFGTRA